MKSLSIFIVCSIVFFLFGRSPSRESSSKIKSELPVKTERAVDVPWQPIGLSGGGSMLAPAYSPADPNLIMLSCDMTQNLISRDGGRNWRVISKQELYKNDHCRPGFHPTDPNVIFAGHSDLGLKVSRDGGEHWKSVGTFKGRLHGEIGIDPKNPDLMLIGIHPKIVATGRPEKEAANKRRGPPKVKSNSEDQGIWRSVDGGETWKKCENGPTGVPRGFHFDQTSPVDQRICFAGTRDGVWRSDDGGVTWIEKSSGLPSWRELSSFAGGSNSKDKVIILYCCVPRRKTEDGRWIGGVYCSLDRGESWKMAMGEGINLDTQPEKHAQLHQVKDFPVAEYFYVLTTDINPSIVYTYTAGTGYAPPHHETFYRSDDAGNHWRSIFFYDPQYKEFNVEYGYRNMGGDIFKSIAYGVAIDPNNPDRLIEVDNMMCYFTENGGKNWQCGYTRPSPGQGKPDKNTAWECNGLLVTVAWNYEIDPFEPNRHYLLYSDIGFARSLDAGKSWIWWGSRAGGGEIPPWRNSCYDLAFDPEIPGKIWGGFSNVSELNTRKSLLFDQRDGPGGICVSTDFTATWKLSSEGLPKTPIMSIVIDPKSPKDRRTLYASAFDHGVYKSTDDGKTWEKKSQGLGAPENMRAYRMQLHSDGTLFVNITAFPLEKVLPGVFSTAGVGLYRSRDNAESWELINSSLPLLWTKDFTVDPHDSKIIYLCSEKADGREIKTEAGVYQTKDGGETWKSLLNKGSHFGVYLHPQHSGWLYATQTEIPSQEGGLWFSRNDGETWKPVDGFPFDQVTRVSFDPADDSIIYVCTYGAGVWRGPSR